MVVTISAGFRVYRTMIARADDRTDDRLSIRFDRKVASPGASVAAHSLWLTSIPAAARNCVIDQLARLIMLRTWP